MLHASPHFSVNRVLSLKFRFVQNRQGISKTKRVNAIAKMLDFYSDELVEQINKYLDDDWTRKETASFPFAYRSPLLKL
jgi:hypothetical protein